MGIYKVFSEYLIILANAIFVKYYGTFYGLKFSYFFIFECSAGSLFFLIKKVTKNIKSDAELRTNISNTHDLPTHLKPHLGGSPFRFVPVNCFICVWITISWRAPACRRQVWHLYFSIFFRYKKTDQISQFLMFFCVLFFISYLLFVLFLFYFLVLFFVHLWVLDVHLEDQ